jgi:hemerythrin-like metal-binding protein
LSFPRPCSPGVPSTRPIRNPGDNQTKGLTSPASSYEVVALSIIIVDIEIGVLGLNRLSGAGIPGLVVGGATFFVSALFGLPSFAHLRLEFELGHLLPFPFAAVAASLKTIGAVDTTLDDYVTEHFAREEAWMQARNHPDLARHQQEHEALRDHLALLCASRDLSDKERSVELLMILPDWLLGHIAHSDRDASGA